MLISVRSELGVVSAEDVLTDDEAQLRNVAAKNPLTRPGFPVASDARGFPGCRFQAPNRALSITGVKSYGGDLVLSRRLPLPVENGLHVLPGDVREAIRFIFERGAGDIKILWGNELSRVRSRAHALLPVFSED